MFSADSSAPREHWGEQRQQRFGSVALILIFCRLDGRLGGAFIHTAHNHFHSNWKTAVADHRGCSHQHKNVPSATGRLCVLCLKKQWVVGEHDVLSAGPGESDGEVQDGKEWGESKAVRGRKRRNESILVKHDWATGAYSLHPISDACQGHTGCGRMEANCFFFFEDERVNVDIIGVTSRFACMI